MGRVIRPQTLLAIPPRPSAPSILLLLDAPLRWLRNLTACLPSHPTPGLQDLENQYRKEKEEADLLLQQLLVRAGRGMPEVGAGGAWGADSAGGVWAGDSTSA